MKLFVLKIKVFVMRDFNNGMSLKKQINLYLDNQLPTQEATDFKVRVEDNLRGQKMLQSEIQFREYIRTNVKRPSVSQGFIENLMTRIQG